MRDNLPLYGAAARDVVRSSAFLLSMYYVETHTRVVMQTQKVSGANRRDGNAG